MVAPAEPLQHRHPAPTKHAHLTGLHAGLELELDVTVEGLNRHGRAQRGLDDRQIDLREDVVALAHEALVRTDANEDVEVARASAERARMALAGETDALAVVDPLRNLDLDRPLVERATCAGARPARMFDVPARTAALGAPQPPDELAGLPGRDLLHPA